MPVSFANGGRPRTSLHGLDEARRVITSGGATLNKALFPGCVGLCRGAARPGSALSLASATLVDATATPGRTERLSQSHTASGLGAPLDYSASWHFETPDVRLSLFRGMRKVAFQAAKTAFDPGGQFSFLRVRAQPLRGRCYPEFAREPLRLPPAGSGSDVAVDGVGGGCLGNVLRCEFDPAPPITPLLPATCQHPITHGFFHSVDSGGLGP